MFALAPGSFCIGTSEFASMGILSYFQPASFGGSLQVLRHGPISRRRPHSVLASTL